MRPASAFIDTNLLILLLVGSVERTLVEKHKRTRNFLLEDYDRLLMLVVSLDRVLVTPNTLTETSNLLNRSQDIRLMKQLKLLIHGSKEVYVASQAAVTNRYFNQLGLTDAALLEAISEEQPLITVDFDLYGAALSRGQNFAYNFTHWQNW